MTLYYIYGKVTNKKQFNRLKRMKSVIHLKDDSTLYSPEIAGKIRHDLKSQESVILALVVGKGITVKGKTVFCHRLIKIRLHNKDIESVDSISEKQVKEPKVVSASNISEKENNEAIHKFKKLNKCTNMKKYVPYITKEQKRLQKYKSEFLNAAYAILDSLRKHK